MGKIICACNQKGGTGKSATVCNLAAGLARAGKRVLCIDGDSQGSLTASFGFRDQDELDISLATILEKVMNDEKIEPGEGKVLLWILIRRRRFLKTHFVKRYGIINSHVR